MGFKGNGAPGQTRTGDPLLRSQLTTLIRTCRSERKARENQQLVINGDKLLAPFSLSRGFAAICYNYYDISMTEKSGGQSRYRKDLSLEWLTDLTVQTTF